MPATTTKTRTAAKKAAARKPAAAKPKRAEPTREERELERTREQLSRAESAALKKIYEGAIKSIDESDVNYVLAKTKNKINALMRTGNKAMNIVANQAALLFKMLRDWGSGQHEIPWKTVAAITAALLYFIGPFDIIPDFIPVLGYLDDATVIGLCLKLAQSDIRKYAIAEKINLREYGLE